MIPGRRSLLFLILLATYLLAVFLVSNISGKTLSDLGFDIWDKAAHFTQYIPIGFLTAGFLAHRPGFPSSVPLAAATALGCVAVFGGLDEIHQYFVPGRESSIFDVLADFLGGGLGAAFGLVVFRKKF